MTRDDLWTGSGKKPSPQRICRYYCYRKQAMLTRILSKTFRVACNKFACSSPYDTIKIKKNTGVNAEFCLKTNVVGRLAGNGTLNVSCVRR